MLLLLLYDLQIKTIKPLLQTDYLNKHKWNTTYHTFVITKASECANLPSIHIYMHTRLTPERGGQSTTIFQGYFTVFPLSLYFNNNFFIKDLLSSLLKQQNSSLRINNLHLQSTSCWLKLIKKKKDTRWEQLVLSSNRYLLMIIFNQCVFTSFCDGNFTFTTQIYRVDLQTLHDDPMFMRWCCSVSFGGETVFTVNDQSIDILKTVWMKTHPAVASC